MINSWQQDLVANTKRNKAPTKIPDDALIEDIKIIPMIIATKLFP